MVWILKSIFEKYSEQFSLWKLFIKLPYLIVVYGRIQKYKVSKMFFEVKFLAGLNTLDVSEYWDINNDIFSTVQGFHQIFL